MQLRTGIIGVGKHGRRYAKHVSEDVEELRLVAISRRDEKSGLDVARRYSCDFVGEASALADRSDLDLLVVAAAPSILAEVVPIAAARGTRLIIEKPVAISLRSGLVMLEEIDRSGIYCMAAQTLRFNPVVRAIAHHVSSLGRVDSLLFSQRFPPQLDIDWLDDPSLSGGGNVLHTGVHCFDLCRVFSGREAESVFCTGRSVYTRRTEDVFTASLALTGDVLATVSCSRTTGSRNGLIEISGEHGQLVGDHVLNTLYHLGESGRTDLPLEPPTHTVLELLRAVVEDCRADSPPRVPYREGLAAIAVADACYASMRSGRAERVVMPQHGP